MSLVELRQQLSVEQSALQQHKIFLRRVTELLEHNSKLPTLLDEHIDGQNTSLADTEGEAWINTTDFLNSIPFPNIGPNSHAFNPKQSSVQPPEHARDASNVDATEDSVALTIENSSSQAKTETTTQQSASDVNDYENNGGLSITFAEQASEELDGPTALPAQIAPPLPEDEAEFTAETQELVDLGSPERPAKVVHLPPEDVQEERRRETEGHKTAKSEDAEQAKRTQPQTQTDPASSPSSTVGPHSAATPMPQQDSPDTSPDSENAEQIEELRPKDMRPSPEERREKDQHDRILAAQKDIARRQALGDFNNADDQLRWEEKAAAAREAEEQTAGEHVGGPEQDAQDANGETLAEEVMEGVERDRQEEVDMDGEGLGTAAEPLTKDLQTQAPTEQEDGDNITVRPRNKLPLSIDTSGAQHSNVDATLQPTPPEDGRMATRTSSGALKKRSVSEIIGQTPSQAPQRRESPSLGEMSPNTARHLQDTPAVDQSFASFQTPRRAARAAMQQPNPNNAQTVLDELSALKGAAEDPERDYLEPLFRIQAHDSPNSRSSNLTELLRTATKTLSTEDQFTTLQERLDYRMLRRIYQLQNANKWSLRQMEKCKEVPQPVTHHDYMMREMQWMRKDFRAERKMKKSVCAWLARRCADWVAASVEERKAMQVKVRPANAKEDNELDEQPPDLEMSGDSPLDDETPPTPKDGQTLPMRLVVPPELSSAVSTLQNGGKLRKALQDVPVAKLSDVSDLPPQRPLLTLVSKFSEGKVLPKPQGPPRKRSRFEYDDGAEADDQPETKRLSEERDLPPEDTEIALFHEDNKAVRNRLHQNNAFRPPSEFAMPATQFYEFRNGSQWLAEDDKKLRDLAKEYSFNWSLIADELQLPGVFKTSAERRTPWECFERWVELEQLPAEMKKTMYFKTWYQRLEQSQQAAERRYQAQVAALQAASNGQANHVPMRRRSTPHRVEKRKNSRYLWLVDAMRKLARKKEQKAYKEAESHRAAAQRKTQNENNQPRAPMLTPAEFSKKRQERDLQIQEAQRQHRAKMVEAQRQQMMQARHAAQQAQQHQQGGPNGIANQQRPGSSSNMAAQQAQMQPNGQPQPNVNGQLPQQQRPGGQMPTRNGHLAVPQMNGQGIPQAQMRPNGQMPNPQDMQRMTHVNAQARNPQYGGQPQYPMPSANMMSPGSGGMSAQQLNQSSQAMMASMQQQMANAAQQSNHQLSNSPHMPPPPTPQTNPQQLSSGHMPAILNIKAQIRNKFPTYTEDQVNQMATEVLKNQSQSSTQARQSAMNAAAGISNMQAYGHNQAAAFANHQMSNGGNYMNGDGSGRAAAGVSPPSPQQYNALMRQRQMQQMQQMQQSPNTAHATLNGSPSVAHASPNMQPGSQSPNMQYAGMNQMAGINIGGQQQQQQQQQRPPSRSNTPQMQRVGSSGNMGGVQSPQQQGVNGLQGQGSPRSVQAGVAR